MSTSSNIINPADYPELDEKLQQAGFGENDPPLLRRAQELGLDQKLERYLGCGQYSRYYACDNGHIHCDQSSRCGLHFLCANCASWYSKSQTARFLPLRKFMSRYAYVTITLNVPATNESISQAEGVMIRTLRGIFQLNCVTVLRVYISKDRTPELRLIRTDPEATTGQLIHIFQEAFLGAKVSVEVHLAEDNFHHSLRRLMADAPFERGDPFRADLENMFRGIRQIHLSGPRIVKLFVCSEKEKKQTDNSTEMADADGKRAKIAHLKCELCGLLMNHLSQWFCTSLHLRGIPLHKLRWKDGWRPQAA